MRGGCKAQRLGGHDYGYHFTAFYRTDYRFITAEDYASQQLLNSTPSMDSILCSDTRTCIVQ
jgi:hypothetical protein